MIEVHLSEHQHPVAYSNKIKELLQTGLDREQAAQFLATNPFRLELYYETGSGLFAVESEALSGNAQSIVSPYSGTPFTDPEDATGSKNLLKELHDEFEKCQTRFENGIVDALVSILMGKGIRKIDFNEIDCEEIPSVLDGDVYDGRALVAAIELDDDGKLSVLLDEDCCELKKLHFQSLLTWEMYDIWDSILRCVLPDIESGELQVNEDGRVVPAPDSGRDQADIIPSYEAKS